MKIKWIVWPVMPLLFSACSSTLSHTKTAESYPETVELMLKETVDDDSTKKEIMN